VGNDKTIIALVVWTETLCSENCRKFQLRRSAFNPKLNPEPREALTTKLCQSALKLLMELFLLSHHRHIWTTERSVHDRMQTDKVHRLMVKHKSTQPRHRGWLLRLISQLKMKRVNKWPKRFTQHYYCYHHHHHHHLPQVPFPLVLLLMNWLCYHGSYYHHHHHRHH